MTKILWILILTVALLGAETLGLAAQRTLPEDNLAYLVLIAFPSGASGSGFYLRNTEAVFLVTAKHVLFDPTNDKLRGNSVTLISYPRTVRDSGRNKLTLDLALLQSVGAIKEHPSEDVAVVRIGTVVSGSTSTVSGTDTGSRSNVVNDTPFTL